MKSKKILAVLMAAGMTLSLAACGSSSDSTDKSADIQERLIRSVSYSS